MKKLFAFCLALCTAVILCSPLHASTALYLPLVANQEQTLLYLPLIANQASQDGRPAGIERMDNVGFTVDQIRLWTLVENRGTSGGQIACGNSGKVQIHVFDVLGDVGGNSRLNGITVKVTQWKNGIASEEQKLTKIVGDSAGIVEFEVADQADIEIVTDLNGESTRSDRATISNRAGAISTENLINSGYCQDQSSCTEFVRAQSCNGHFSWNVVFKRKG